MRIAYVTAYDPRDVSQWSGLGYFIWQSLAARGIDVELIGPLHVPWVFRKVGEYKWHWNHRLYGRFYWMDGDLIRVRAYSRDAGSKLKWIPPVDAVVSATAASTAFLPGDVPLVIYSDSTLKLLYETYPLHANMPPELYRHSGIIESNAHRRASALVYSSQWAADSARRDYSADPAKIHVVPFGANLAATPPRAAVEEAIEARAGRQVRLLFMGVDWERKGGPDALAVVRHLNQSGIPAHLTVIGCQPQIAAEDLPYVTVLGFIEKGGPGQARIQQELARSHFLIVLSMAECFGLVYAEASSSGVPSIARNVGGVASAVRNGRNGQLFDPADSPSQIADWIASTFRDFAAYRRLALSSLAEFETELNWRVAGERLERIIRSVIRKPGG